MPWHFRQHGACESNCSQNNKQCHVDNQTLLDSTRIPYSWHTAGLGGMRPLIFTASRHIIEAVNGGEDCNVCCYFMVREMKDRCVMGHSAGRHCNCCWHTDAVLIRGDSVSLGIQSQKEYLHNWGIVSQITISQTRLQVMSLTTNPHPSAKCE